MVLITNQASVVVLTTMKLAQQSLKINVISNYWQKSKEIGNVAF